MNILFCGDNGVIDGITIAGLSLAKQVTEPLKIFVLTMDFEYMKKKYYGIRAADLAGLEVAMKRRNPESELKILDIGELFRKDPVTANRRSYFTPYCMLRLYADQVPELPAKILYLDTDVVCLNNPMEFYNMDNSQYEMVGVIDRYGGKIFRKPMQEEEYLNSGVLLLNLDLIRKTGFFRRAREMCKKQPMLLPDQTALNFCVKYKKIVGNKYNEQKAITKDTVFRHFSNTFQFFPYLKVQKVKPWEPEKLHQILGVHEFDDVLAEWQKIKEAK